jgi:hypothetical protein
VTTKITSSATAAGTAKRRAAAVSDARATAQRVTPDTLGGEVTTSDL